MPMGISIVFVSLGISIVFVYLTEENFPMRHLRNSHGFAQLSD